jgi:hypothetical protein
MSRQVLEEFLRLDASPDVRILLRDALRDCEQGVQPMMRRFEFNQFEVSINGENQSVLIEDVIDTSDEGTCQTSFAEFAKALGS